MTASTFGGGLQAGNSLDPSRLVVGSAPAAQVAGQGTFLFSTTTGALLWDADGSGGAAATQVATLQGVTSLSASDFEVI